MYQAGWVLTELVEVLAKPLSTICKQSCVIWYVLIDWRIANGMLMYKKGWNENPGNFRPVSLTSVPGKVVEQLFLSAITQHIQDSQAIRSSQHGFMKGRSCLTNLISCYDKVTCLVDKRKAVDVAYVDFSKTFDIVFHNILIGKLAAYGLHRCAICWVKNWLDGQAQRVVVNGIKPVVIQLQVVFFRALYQSQFCLISLSLIWMRGLSTASVSLQATPS